MIHELKILPVYFDAVVRGEKTFEIRKFDRPFNKGDLLALNEFEAGRKCYTGNSVLVYIDYILNNPDFCKSGYVVMSIKPCSVCRHTEPINMAKMCADYSVPLATRGEE